MAYVYQNYVQPAQELFGYHQKPYAHTHYEQIDSAQSSPYTPHSATPFVSGFPTQEHKPSSMNEKRLRTFNKLKRTVGVVFGVADVISCLLTLFIECVMVYMLVKFYKTRNIPAPGRNGPWAKETKLWPTYMMAGAAGVTFLLALVGAIMSCRHKNKDTKKAQITIKVVRVAVHVGSWIAVAAFYRIAKTGQDLWGWSCSEKAEAIQQYYNTSLQFDALCKAQTGTWVISLAEVALKIVFAAVGFYFKIKLEGVKRSIIRDLGEVGFETFQNVT